MEFNREEFIYHGASCLQEVTDKSKSEDFDKQKFDSDIMSLINKINGK